MYRPSIRMVGAAGAGLASLALLDMADRRRIAADPVRDLLRRDPEGGESSEVVSADGTRLHVKTFGPEDAPAIVLVHGWTCSIKFWRLQLHELTRDHRVIAFDLRGHGESGSPEGDDWSPDALADDLEAVLRACLPEGRKAVIAGHSLGAMTIVAWAGRHPDSVQRSAAAVALLNTGIGDLISEALVVRTPTALGWAQEAIGVVLLGLAAPLPPRPDPITHRAVRYIALAPSASPAAVRHTEEMVLGVRPRVRALFGREMSRLDLRDRVEHLTVPTLVMAGEADRLTPPVHARDLAGSLPDCTGMVELEGTGHMGPVERAAEVNDALRDLAGRHAAVTPDVMAGRLPGA
jgi:pimeloyl-ACP methyl ester carboxylesterase